jgi:hypothetical protein
MSAIAIRRNVTKAKTLAGVAASNSTELVLMGLLGATPIICIILKQITY